MVFSFSLYAFKKGENVWVHWGDAYRGVGEYIVISDTKEKLKVKPKYPLKSLYKTLTLEGDGRHYVYPIKKAPLEKVRFHSSLIYPQGQEIRGEEIKKGVVKSWRSPVVMEVYVESEKRSYFVDVSGVEKVEEKKPYVTINEYTAGEGVQRMSMLQEDYERIFGSTDSCQKKRGSFSRIRDFLTDLIDAFI